MITALSALIVLATTGSDTSSESIESIVFQDIAYDCLHDGTHSEVLKRDGATFSSPTWTVRADDAARIRAVLIASEGKPFEPRDLGITPELVESRRPAIAKQLWPDHQLSQRELERVVTFEHVSAAAERVIADGFRLGMPKHNVMVRFEGPVPVEASANGLLSGMLPWRIRVGDRTFTTWSVDVPRALESILKLSPMLGAGIGRHFWPEGFLRSHFAARELMRVAGGITDRRIEPLLAEQPKRWRVAKVDLQRAAKVFMLDLQPNDGAVIDSVGWSIGVADDRLVAGWPDLTSSFERVEAIASGATWLRRWKTERAGRVVHVSIDGSAPFDPAVQSANVAAWKAAGLQGAPAAQLELIEGTKEVGFALFSPSDARALVVWQTKPRTSSVMGP
jgi:hypothetical protein